MGAFRATVDAALLAAGHPVTNVYEWLGVMGIRNVEMAAARVISTRASDAAFIANQIEFDALVAQYAMQESA